MPDLTPEYRAHLRQNCDQYGDPLVIQLLDALEAAEAAVARVHDLVTMSDGSPRSDTYFLPASTVRAALKGTA